MYPKKDKYGKLIFPDHPEFKPNKTPAEIFKAGAFDGIYFRPIKSGITGKQYKNIHKKYKFLNGIPEDKLARPLENADIHVNKYKVHVGTTLEFWESKGWITKYAPYGWMHWYCDFYSGIRSPDDERQIKRWLGVCGDNGRFRNNLIKQIYKDNKKWNDLSVSPRIRQTLLHWGYELNKRDYDAKAATFTKSSNLNQFY